MNDYLLIIAIRQLPKRYLLPGINITRYGATDVVAAHPDRPSLVFKGKKWIVLTMRQVSKRG